MPASSNQRQSVSDRRARTHVCRAFGAAHVYSILESPPFQETRMSDLCVKSLHIHPVKSTAVQDVDVLKVTADGADGDRRYMLIDESGHAITAREVPKLVLVRAALSESGIVLTGPGMSDLEVGEGEGRLAKVTVWSDAVEDLTVSEEASRWFTGYLGQDCRLVRVRPASSRKGHKPFRPKAFQDAEPLLVTGTGSLDELNGRLADPVTMAHFRPNVVVSGSPPFDEDCWAQFRIGDVVFEGLYGCGRCAFTTIDPGTADKLKKGEPLRTLATWRQGNDNQVYFGLNARVTGGGTIRIGDRVEVLERRTHLKTKGDYVSELTS